MIAGKRLRFGGMTLIVVTLLLFGACAGPENTQNIEDCFRISSNDDLSYSYEITDNKGNILISENSAIREPNITPLTVSVLEVSTQTGTGLSTNWSIYCDVEKSKVSEKFRYVLGAKDGYVFYVKYEENTLGIICQDIFDPQSYKQEYNIDDPLVVFDSFSRASFDTEGVAKISYLTGDTAISETHIAIYFP